MAEFEFVINQIAASAGLVDHPCNEVVVGDFPERAEHSLLISAIDSWRVGRAIRAMKWVWQVGDSTFMRDMFLDLIRGI